MQSRRWIFIFSIFFIHLLGGCAVDANVEVVDNTPQPKGAVQEPSYNSTGSREMIHGQYKVTASGYKLNAQFYQISEKKVLANGYKLEGVFND